MRTLKERIKNFKMPHTYVILVTIMFIVLILTHIIPAGSYERVEDAVTGKMVVVPDSYAYVDAEAPGLFGLFQALEAGYVDAADIMFLIIFAYGFVYVLIKNGTNGCCAGNFSTEDWQLCPAIDSDHNADSWFNGIYYGYL